MLETHKGKKKRMKRNESLKRNFKCGCGKDYLSDSALYTHIKQKHGGKKPEGTIMPITDFKLRRRPPVIYF